MPQNIVYLITAGFYFLMIAVFGFFSLFTAYILVRYGRSRIIALTTSGIYVIFFLILLVTSLKTLSQLNVI